MTQPNPLATPLPDSSVPAVVWEHDAAALALELAAADAVTGPVRADLAGIAKGLRLRWVAQFGPRAGKQQGAAVRMLASWLAGELRQVRVTPSTPLLGYLQQAQDLGVQQGFEEAGLPAQRLRPILPLDTHLAVAQAASDARQRLQTAVDTVQTLDRGDLSTLATWMAPAQSVVGVLERDARTLTNERLNGGIGLVADHVDGQLLWLAERDACLTCLALSGQVVDAGAEFDMTASFGRPTSWVPDGGLVGPPRHPRCRCRTTVWFGGTADIPSPRQSPENTSAHAVHRINPDLPAVLRREAERSVLYGWARPSESDTARTRAADTLLTTISSRDGVSPSGWRVPKSVRTQAQRRLSTGKFGATPFPGK